MDWLKAAADSDGLSEPYKEELALRIALCWSRLDQGVGGGTSGKLQLHGSRLTDAVPVGPCQAPPNTARTCPSKAPPGDVAC